MDQPVFHVMLEGRKVGPYDRRTIVGMRIKKTLSSDHVLFDSDGVQLTVADLIGQRPRDNSFHPNRSGSFSIVQATYSASLIEVEGRGFDIPKFKDEIEARVQADVLRLAGRFRQGLGWKEDRVKLPLKDVVHARVKGSCVELWLRAGEGKPLQRVALELFTPEAAGELVEWLPDATPWPEPGVTAVVTVPASVTPPVAMPRGANPHMLWVAIFSIALVIAVLLVLVLVMRR